MVGACLAPKNADVAPWSHVRISLLHIKYNNANKIKNTLYIQDEIGYNTNKADSSNDIESE